MKKYVLKYFARPKLEIIVLVFLVIYGYQMIKPLFGVYRGLKMRLSELKHRISDVQVFAPQLKKLEPASFTEIKNLQGVAMAEVFSEIQKLASQEGVVLERIKFNGGGAEGEKQLFRNVSFELSLRSPEAAYLKFLRGLRRLNFLCRVNHLKVRADAKNEGMILSDVYLEKIDILGPVSEKDLSQPFLKEGSAEKLQDASGFLIKGNLFKMPVIKVAKDIQVSQGQGSGILKNLKLVGIVDDGGVKAALEDLKTQKTYFLKEGDSLAGLKLDEIKKDEVIFEAEGAQYSLVM